LLHKNKLLILKKYDMYWYIITNAWIKNIDMKTRKQNVFTEQ
jgi:hypothetical protein